MNNRIITFKEGIPGFENLKEFILLEEVNSKFYYLQAVEEEEICFVVINPYEFVENYTPKINEGYFAKLGGGATEEFVLYNILTLGKNLEETTANLQAPLLIHAERREGVQVIVEDRTYKTKTKLGEIMRKRSI